MKQKTACWFGLVLFSTMGHPLVTNAQNTAFTYQGRLNDGTAPANGSYDVRFALYDALTAGVQQGGTLTNSAIGVSNGLFTTTLDFGNVANGTKLWLELGVRTNGGGTFTPLLPRQPLTPTPYSMFAYTASNLSGALPPGSVTATQLAPGASLSNLTASGQSGVPSGGMILSQSYYDSNLVNAGYQKLGRVDIAETWEKRASPAVAGRENHTALWTGSELIIWGGNNGSTLLNTGARYNPLANTWQTMSTNNAPPARALHTAVWTGTEMLVWGGGSNLAYLATGGRYDPVADKWTPINDSGAPLARLGHTAIWTGSEMIIWGGYSNTTYYSKGARYNPNSDTWTPLNNTGEPSGRSGHTAVWTGTEMIVWGGYDGTNIVSTGGRYSPVTNNWNATTNLFAPAASGHSAIWTGSEMIIFGGYSGAYVNNCTGYFPSTNAWFNHSNLNAPSGRGEHAAFWTGSEMIIWGGHNLSTTFSDGGRFNLQSGSWSSISTNAAPSPRTARAVWTGSDMIVNDGFASIYYNETFSYTLPRVSYLYQRP